MTTNGLLCLLVLTFWEAVFGHKLTISSTTEFLDFSKFVNSGTAYIGTTVFLGADIDFTDELSDQFEPIGTPDSYFLGSFDGQGYTIRNLNVISSLQNVGMFGYLSGATIRNVVVDEACTFTSTSAQGQAHIGSVVGKCNTESMSCIIENSVTMASVSFTGSASDCSVFVGTIAGHIDMIKHAITVKNCVNYGPVTSLGRAKSYMIGGIVGYFKGDDYKASKVVNCINFGTISFSGTATDSLQAGGIAGNVCYMTATIANCVSAGGIESSKVGSFGTILGSGHSELEITHCYWVSNVGTTATKACASGTPITIESSLIELNATSVENLNDYAEENSWDAWLLNANEANVTFRVNGGTGLSLSSKLVPFLGFAEESSDHLFSGWFTDSDRTKELTETVVYENTTLYGVWSFTITFSADGGIVGQESKVVTYSSVYGELPVPTREGYTFNGWFIGESKSRITSATIVNITSSQTLYPRWDADSYIISFDGNGGSPPMTFKKVTYDNVYGELPKPSMVGYTFVGWFTSLSSEGKSVYSSDEVKITSNQKLYARWAINIYTVTFKENGGTCSQRTKTVAYNSAYGELPNVTRVGHTFVGWFIETNDGYDEVKDSTVFTSTTNVTLYAFWTINKYLVSFDYGNGTVVESLLNFGDKIKYPPDPEKEGYTFAGWDNDILNVPASKVTFRALWEKQNSSSSESNDNTAFIVIGIVVPIFLIAVISLLVAAFSLFKIVGRIERNEILVDDLSTNSEGSENSSSQDTQKQSYRVVVTPSEVNGGITLGKTLDSLYKMYPKGFARPTMEEALLDAGFTEGQTDKVVEACENASQSALEDGKLFERFTEEDAAAITMYTYDFGAKKFESNPYRIINRSLVDRNYAGLQRASGLLYLVMTALRKLPRVTGITLYRGVRSEVKMDEDHYYEGNTITWPALSSTSPDMKTVKTFTAKGSKTGKTTGTLFIIENGWGYDIQPYSLFPEEAEILLEPERQFKVISIDKNSGIITIKLHMLDTPLALSQVFGEGVN